MTTLTGLVSAGAGVGFVTEGIATVIRPGVIYRPITPEPPSMPMAVAWRQGGPSPVGQRFIDVVCDGRRDAIDYRQALQFTKSAQVKAGMPPTSPKRREGISRLANTLPR
jgi:hypothetical protein